jgi:lipopolysaccharide/colanic/teichoic acid biosynthesis glycosyltransferase
MDVVLSTIVLVLLWPLLLAIAIAIKLESPGPVIYPSLRVGKNGRRFVCYKFRTMVPGADELKDTLRRLNQRRGPFFKIADDPRVTRLGRFLRKYSLDELPQFWNVLKSEMSLVGPRPHPLDDVERYSPWHHGRVEVKPGLTGLWQVTAR